MPHVIVELWPGKSDQQKSRLAEAIARDVMDLLGSGEASLSVAFEEFESKKWAARVYRPDVAAHP
jgi:4-oxalocrotonate tautomerase